MTLDSSPRHLQSSWERRATQFSWASFLSGFGFQFRMGTPSAMLANCASIIPIHSQKYIDRRAWYPCVSQGLACDHHSYPASIRTLEEPHGARCTLGFDLKPGPITTVTGLAGWVLPSDWRSPRIWPLPAVTRTRRVDVVAANLSDNESASVSSKDLLFTGCLSFRDCVSELLWNMVGSGLCSRRSCCPGFYPRVMERFIDIPGHPQVM